MDLAFPSPSIFDFYVFIIVLLLLNEAKSFVLWLPKVAIDWLVCLAYPWSCIGVIAIGFRLGMRGQNTS